MKMIQWSTGELIFLREAQKKLLRRAPCHLSGASLEIKGDHASADTYQDDPLLAKITIKIE